MIFYRYSGGTWLRVADWVADDHYEAVSTCFAVSMATDLTTMTAQGSSPPSILMLSYLGSNVWAATNALTSGGDFTQFDFVQISKDGLVLLVGQLGFEFCDFYEWDGAAWNFTYRFDRTGLGSYFMDLKFATADGTVAIVVDSADNFDTTFTPCGRVLQRTGGTWSEVAFLSSGSTVTDRTAIQMAAATPFGVVYSGTTPSNTIAVAITRASSFRVIEIWIVDLGVSASELCEFFSADSSFNPTSLALTSDGDTLFVGDADFNALGTAANTGRVYKVPNLLSFGFSSFDIRVYDTFPELSPYDASGNPARFGLSVSCDANGSQIVVGSQYPENLVDFYVNP